EQCMREDVVLKDLEKRYGITFEMSYRRKGAFSTWYKIKKKGIESNENLTIDKITDIDGARFVVEKTANGTERKKLDDHDIDELEIKACRRMVAILSEMTSPNEGAFPAAEMVLCKDYFGENQKGNGYESLHPLLKFQGRFMDIQIRNRRMDNWARYSDG